MASPSITFAKNKKGEVVHVDQVSNGLACECTCICCESPLVARHGAVMGHHFAHAKEANCSAAYESSLHLAMKDLIQRRKKIKLPEYSVNRSIYSRILEKTIDNTQSTKPGIINFDEVILEKKIGSIIPDVIGFIGGKQLLIEIAVTHFIDDEKLKEIKRLNLSCIEIDLSKIVRSQDKKYSWTDLEELVDQLTTEGRWINNTKHKAMNAKAMQIIKERKSREEAEFISARERWLIEMKKEEDRLYEQASRHYYHKEVIKTFGPNPEKVAIINFKSRVNNAIEAAPYLWQGFILLEYLFKYDDQISRSSDIEQHTGNKFNFRSEINSLPIKGARYVVSNYIDHLVEVGFIRRGYWGMVSLVNGIDFHAFMQPDYKTSRKIITPPKLDYSESNYNENYSAARARLSHLREELGRRGFKLNDYDD